MTKPARASSGEHFRSQGERTRTPWTLRCKSQIGDTSWVLTFNNRYSIFSSKTETDHKTSNFLRLSTTNFT